MNRLFTYFVAILFGISLFSFQSTSPEVSSPARRVQQGYSLELQNFGTYTEALHRQAELFIESQDAAPLQAALLQARNQFKKVEFLVAYREEEYVKDWLNGAPLPHLERNMASVIQVLEPEGLQILDELIFGEEVLEEAKHIEEKAQLLVAKTQHIVKYITRISPPMDDREILESCREGLVRIYTLGVTGFDTPMSGNSLPEARIGLESMSQMLSHYADTLEYLSPGLYPQLQETFEGSIAYLTKHDDFDTFDRLHFLKAYINPLYSTLLDVHQTLKLPHFADISAFTLSTNYSSRNLFAEDFLNPNFYTQGPTSNASSEAIALGKILFFDPILSGSNERACASCHQPQKAFTDGLPKSLALNFEGTVNRNAPTVINSVYSKRFFHDLRSAQLERQIEHVIFDKKEFHTNFFEIFDKLQQSEEYVQLFTEAFPKHTRQPISQQTLATALAAYVKSLNGFNSPVDQYIRGEIETLSEEVKNGYNLFMGKAACGTCHFAPTFNGTVPPLYTESESEILGVAVKHDTLQPQLDEDLGRYNNGRPTDRLDIYKNAFKTPTVRNIGLTAPYMHNGAYHTLEEVVDFYNRGGGVGMGLDVPNQTLPPDPLGLSQQEMGHIVKFMEALTDTIGMTAVPKRLPTFPAGSKWNDRVIGGKY